MYKKGDLQLTDPPCDEDYDPETATCKHWEGKSHVHAVCDTRDEDETREDYYNFYVHGAYLPHSCDEWVIGDEEQIKNMIEDLQVALKELEKRK